MGIRTICAMSALFSVATLSSAVAQQSSVRESLEPPSVARAVRAIPEGPRIDGLLDEPVWQSAPVFSNFVQRNPNEGDPATERTEFRVLYTDEALYVGVRAFDSQADRIAAFLTRRDMSSPSDLIRVMIDSYHDRRTGFQFAVNAAGVKLDAFLYDDTNEDSGWDAVWDVGTMVDAEGWTAEFRIPFSQLRFAKADVNTFGFNVYRNVSRLNEEQYWRPLPKSARGMVSLFGDLTGIERITPPRRLEVVPYTVASTVEQTPQAGNPFQGRTSGTARVGADIKYGINSALTLSATINPDFGQVEADPAVVNLSAFETFFPEQRPFFGEGLDIFRFRIADGDGDGSEEGLFYTRRIGRRPQGAADDRGGSVEPVNQTTIITAAKLSGKTQDGWTIGLMGALTGQEEASVVDSLGVFYEDQIEPTSGYLVGRLSRDFRGGQSRIGLFGTTVRRSLPDRLTSLHSGAYTGGVDWIHRFRDDTYQFTGRAVASYVAGSQEAIASTQLSSARYFQRPDADHVDFDPTRRSLSGFTVAMNLGKMAGDWRWSTGFQTRSPGFEVNDIGFQRSADMTSQWIWLNRRWLQPGKVFRRFNVNLNQWAGWTYGGENTSLGANLNANYTLLNYWSGWFGINRQLKRLTVTHLRGGPAMTRPGALNGWFGLESDGRKTLRGGGNGWFYLQDEDETWGAGVNANLSWRPATNLDFTASPSINWNREQWQYLQTLDVAGTDEFVLGDLHQTTVSMTLRGNVTLSPTFSLQGYVEPFMSAGRYEGFNRVVAPGAEKFLNQFQELDALQVSQSDLGLEIDIDRDGVADGNLGQPDFTYLSLRSNLVLRWEYLLGSTMFVVWQHGRARSSSEGRFDLGTNMSDLFTADHQNVFLVKLNYWINP